MNSCQPFPWLWTAWGVSGTAVGLTRLTNQAERTKVAASMRKAAVRPKREATRPPRAAPRANIVLQVTLLRALAVINSWRLTRLGRSAERAGSKKALRLSWRMVKV